MVKAIKYTEYWLKDVDQYGDCHNIIGFYDTYNCAVEVHRNSDVTHRGHNGHFEIEQWSCICNDDEGLIDRESINVWRGMSIAGGWTWVKWDDDRPFVEEKPNG